MQKAGPVLITIQKFVYLLNEVHYSEFAAHLHDINATMPLMLIKAIRNKLPEFDTHEELCKKIYGNFEKGSKQNFNQLAAYTFRLSNVLALNYPDYLRHNVNKIERLVNSGDGREAHFLAEILLEIAERTEDFQCCIFALGFLSQQAFIVKDVAAGLRFDAVQTMVLDKEKTLLHLQLLARQILSTEKKEKLGVDKTLNYLLEFEAEASAAIRIFSRYCYLLILRHLDLPSFEKTETPVLIKQLEKDLHNNAHVVLPGLIEIHKNLGSMKVRTLRVRRVQKTK